MGQNGIKRSSRRKDHLALLDMNKSMRRKDYEKKLAKVQKRLRQIQQAYLFTGDSAAIVFEGWDAGGKGGTIRRMSAVLDPRGFKVWPIAAPRRYHLERHYLTRFWERLPPDGAISVFDRSWYGRVLVERVEGFATESAWHRAYDEINEFEKMLIDDGRRIVKFFLHVTPEEQLHRFERRLNDPMKRWKLSYEDFRNRDKWEQYEDAINDMVERTSTEHAPWHLVPANSKKWARIQILTLIADTLSEGVTLGPRPIDEKVQRAAHDALGESETIVESTVGRHE